MNNNNKFLKGALIGSALAGIASLLLAPKPGKMLIADILDIYDSVQKNGSDFIEAIKEKSSCLTNWEEEECDHCHCSLLIGGALGAIVGAVAALLLAPDSSNKLRKMLGKHYDHIQEQAEDFVSSIEKKGGNVINDMNDWKDILIQLINKLSGSKTTKENQPRSNINEIINLAQTGLRLYQQLQKRR